MTAWFRDWLTGLAVAIVTAAGLALLCVLVLSLQGSPFWTELLLEPPYRKPELVGSYAPELMEHVQWSAFACIGAALAGFTLWQLTVLVARPTGPGQVRWSWRSIVWLTLLVLVGGAGGIAPYWLLAVRLDGVDAEAARRLAAILGPVAISLFWLLSVLSAGRMMRPAVPLGRMMPVQ